MNLKKRRKQIGEIASYLRLTQALKDIAIEGLFEFLRTFQQPFFSRLIQRDQEASRAEKKRQIYDQIYHMLMKNYQDHHHRHLLKECTMVLCALRALPAFLIRVHSCLTCSPALRAFVLYVASCFACPFPLCFLVFKFIKH